MLNGQGLQLVAQFAYFVVVAHVLGPTGYGTFVACTALVLTVAPFSPWGTGHVMVKYAARNPDVFPTYFGNAILVTLISAAGASSFSDGHNGGYHRHCRSDLHTTHGRVQPGVFGAQSSAEFCAGPGARGRASADSRACAGSLCGITASLGILICRSSRNRYHRRDRCCEQALRRSATPVQSPCPFDT
jgi:hypothetical protein